MDTITEKIKIGKLEITLYYNLTNSKKSRAMVKINGTENWFVGDITHDVQQSDIENIHTREMIR